ncbi:MAG: hydrogenase formation protein HypD [Candidatus Eremiobacteraeota bacterium]|nr:hydrogenase formation protein HypD [Candidatus Eremiobacteraeota bacterium]
MRFKEEFRNHDMARALAEKIAGESSGQPMTFMEVCGTHTMALHRYGIPGLLPSSIRLLSGPGCPVCVTPNEAVDRAVAYSRKEGCILATFGDMARVPGSESSLMHAKAEGASVAFLYSPRDAIQLAQSRKDRIVVFLAIGFETTAPTVASMIEEARELGIGNLLVITAMKTIPMALKALVSTEELGLDGFLLPGHLSVITGTSLYEFLPEEHGIACVVSGFEPLDILQSLLMLVRQVRHRSPLVENQYIRVVKKEGNRKAMALIAKVFREGPSRWRGIGDIPASGLSLAGEYRDFDALEKLPVSIDEPREKEGCLCGMILRGLRTPRECPLFARACTPEEPVGACMVSSEGTCAAWYKYRRGEETP